MEDIAAGADWDQKLWAELDQVILNHDDSIPPPGTLLHDLMVLTAGRKLAWDGVPGGRESGLRGPASSGSGHAVIAGPSFCGYSVRVPSQIGAVPACGGA
jgi:hypothetical protein